MCEVFVLSVRIYAVSEGSPAEKAGIAPGDRIVSINGEPVTDEIDYQALSAVSGHLRFFAVPGFFSFSESPFAVQAKGLFC